MQYWWGKQRFWIERILIVKLFVIIELVYSGEQNANIDKWICRICLKQRIKLFIILQSYLFPSKNFLVQARKSCWHRWFQLLVLPTTSCLMKVVTVFLQKNTTILQKIILLYLLQERWKGGKNSPKIYLTKRKDEWERKDIW